MIRAHSFVKYVEFAGQGGCTRSEAAVYFNVHKTTAQYNLEKGVETGDLERWWGYVDDRQQGWLYRQVGSNQPLPFEDDPEGYDDGFDWDGEEARLMERGEMPEQVFDISDFEDFEIALEYDDNSPLL